MPPRIKIRFVPIDTFMMNLSESHDGRIERIEALLSIFRQAFRVVKNHDFIAVLGITPEFHVFEQINAKASLLENPGFSLAHLTHVILSQSRRHYVVIA